MTPTASVAETPALAASRHQLGALGRRYALRRAAALLLPALAGALLLAGLAQHWPGATWPLVGAGALALGLAAWRLAPLGPLPAAAVARRLDRRYPSLEDSAGLLLLPPENLSLLEQFQQQRVAGRLEQLADGEEQPLPVDFRRPGLLALGLLVAGAAAWFWPAAGPRAAAPAAVPVHFTAPAARPGAPAPARILETQLLVTPPAYTRRAAFAPAQASFRCPQGARVRWRVRVSRAAASGAPVLEMGGRRVAFQPVAGAANTFETEQILNASVLYRLRFADTVSDDYSVDVQADQAPAVRILTPKAYTLVPAREARSEVPVRALLRDDYGLSHAELVITVAQGAGEAVKFREVRRDLSGALGPQPAQTTVGSLLNLKQLGLTYGDELYFYIAARDNAGHSARSDAYLVQWQDTAQAAGVAGLMGGPKVAPAYFRSQRQLIIDTQKLLAERKNLTSSELTTRANDLGADQQALRLRYGKFMGEELEPGIGVTAGPETEAHPAPRAESHSPIAEDDDAPAPAATPASHDDHDHEASAPTGRNASPTAETDALMEPYIHKHDDSETADFLEPAVKTKLRAVLDQMWAAELRLRTGQLTAALPYEYKALRLLKEVQQQTRAFVKKAGFAPPAAPEPNLRLTGDLKGAAAPRLQAQVAAPAAQPAVRGALAWLAASAAGQPARPADARLLEPAGAALAQAAVQRPGAYLGALRDLRRLLSDVRAARPPCPDCRSTVARALTDLLPPPPPADAAPPAPDRLARRYFQNLSR
ncbi:DUF4175 family protein [Hymenobacter nivis]|uniref:DUF4175 family protein n=1 Tax=Hymenobacter nivis TaxID=1850093 RepID=A0A502GZM4_9BACT|nr:hypothetical protein [Hymenobacter nivis]TPG66590.1 hypothetical protein EAH73_09345 [Hymenobacter nivis]